MGGSAWFTGNPYNFYAYTQLNSGQQFALENRQPTEYVDTYIVTY